MHKGHAVLAALVVAAALWAYLVLHPPDGGAPVGPGAVRVWDVPSRAVQALTYDDGSARTVLHARGDGGAARPSVWVETHSPAPGPETPQGGRPAGGAPRVDAFRGNAAAWETLERFARLTATRDLGALEVLDAAQLGFPAPGAFLELARREGAPLRLELGRATHGQGGRYAHAHASGRVYLLREGELRGLARARGGLMDRELLGLRPEQAARLELATGGQARTFHRLTEAGAWGAAPEATEPLTEVAQWLMILDRLKVVRYGAEDEPATPGPPALELRLYRGGDAEPAAWLRLYAATGQTARARSSYTEREVEVAGPVLRQVLETARALLPGT